MHHVWQETALELPEGFSLIEALGGLELAVGIKRFILLKMLKERLPDTHLARATWPEVPWHSPGEGCMTKVLRVVDCDILPDYSVLESPEASIAWLDRDIGRPPGRVDYRHGTFTYTTTSGRSLVWKKERDGNRPTGTLRVDFGNQGSVELLCQIMARLGLPEELLAPMGY